MDNREIVQRLLNLAVKYDHPATYLVLKNIDHRQQAPEDAMFALVEFLLKENAALKQVTIQALNNSALPSIVIGGQAPEGFEDVTPKRRDWVLEDLRPITQPPGKPDISALIETRCDGLIRADLEALEAECAAVSEDQRHLYHIEYNPNVPIGHRMHRLVRNES